MVLELVVFVAVADADALIYTLCLVVAVVVGY